MGRRLLKGSVLGACIAAIALPAWAQNAPGVTDTEIKIGQTMPYTGPVTAFSTLGKGEVAYFKMLNDQGGVNGRKINLLSLDDGYAPPRTVEQTRKLVEQDGVAFIFSSIGTATNTAIVRYLNSNKVPQLYIASGASKFGNYKEFPWTIGGIQATFRAEARIYARQILKEKPNAKIAMLYQNDDFGRDYVLGLKDVLGDKYADTVKEATYEFTDATVDSQVVSLQATGADAFILVATPKFAAQAIRKVYDIGWKPMFYITNVAGRCREGGRSDVVGLREGSGRSGLGQRSRHEGVESLDDKIHAGSRPARSELCQFLQQRDGDRAGAQAGR